MMVIYGNSVNTDESDLQIIFNVLEKIAIESNIKNYNEAMEIYWRNYEIIQGTYLLTMN